MTVINEPQRQLILRLGQLAVLGSLGVLTVIDANYSLYRDNVLIAGGQCLVTVAVALVWLPSYQTNSTVLAVFAVAIAGASIGVTCALLLARPPDQMSTSELWGLAEAAGFLPMMFVLARKATFPLAVIAIVLGEAALLVQPFRSGMAPLMGLMQAMAASYLVGGALYLRRLEGDNVARLAMARARQRMEFACDLHDFIAHHVTGIVVQAQGARLVAERQPHLAVQALDQIERAGAETMAAMRRMVGALRDPTGQVELAPLAGVADLPSLIASFNEGGGAQALLRVDGAVEELPVDITTAAYRVVMESLTNVRQHAAQVTSIEISVRRTADWVFVRVSDNGAPRHHPGIARGRGFGLDGLADRVSASGGWLAAGPGTERGWVVEAGFALREEMGRGYPRAGR